ncbi:ADP-ribosylation factor-like protein 6-interacting protein 1 [Glossina fuscipes]|uniref:ADP-ribosylation factor-like protein 6-interacting protein 1 n=1 Tax=Glossina fuscipes TaxID=7396 RepID=A0A9C6DZU5_9MUSC|nr:ADP-ribosylation factor-like protein 6-interacting protein 1 [Glossina fuscipes]
MSQVDVKRAFNKMKHDLEPWRNLIVLVDSVLNWERNYYPAALFGGITSFYLLLWVLQLSVVTMLAITGLFGVLFDYLYPSVKRMFFNIDNWSGDQEAQFERIVNELTNINLQIMAWYDYLFINKERKSCMFVIAMSGMLLTLAWIGAIFNNMLLMYLVTISVVMYPGVQNRGLLTHFKDKFGSSLTNKMEKLRELAKKQE